MPELALAQFAQAKWKESKHDGLVFSHVQHKMGSLHSRLSAVIDAFCAAASDEQEVFISYLLPNPSDVFIARSRYKETIRATKDKGNALKFIEFGSWKDTDDHKKQILLLDADHSRTSSIDGHVMLEITQKLETRIVSEELSCLVVTISGDVKGPVWRDRIDTEFFTVEGQQYRAITHYDDTWLTKATELLEEKLKSRMDTLADIPEHQVHLHAEKYGPTFVLLMRYAEARFLFEKLKRISVNVELGCIMPWFRGDMIQPATSRSQWLKLIYIDDRVGVMPLIEGAEVLVGPFRDGFHFDLDIICGVAIPDVDANVDDQLQAAFSLSSKPPIVHTFPRKVLLPADALGLAFGPQLLHWQLGIIKNCKDRHPLDLPIRFPNDMIMSSEAVRRLGEWGLVEFDEKSFETHRPRPRLGAPLGTDAGRFSKFTSNINALVLLGCAEERRTPRAVFGVLVDLAVIVCQGPSSMFYPVTADTKRKVEGKMRLLNGPFANLVDRGQLWLSLACLDAYRRAAIPEELRPLMIDEVLSRIQGRASTLWTAIFGQVRDQQVELTVVETRIVEEKLARAFLFNTLLTAGSDDFFAADIISRVKLTQSYDDPLDWDRLHQESDTAGVVAGVYTHLEALVNDDLTTIVGYRPRDVTVISLRAVSKVLGELEGGKYLPPLWTPNTALRIEEHVFSEHFDGIELGEDEEAAVGGQQDAPTSITVSRQDGGSAGAPSATAKVKGTQDSATNMQSTSPSMTKQLMMVREDAIRSRKGRWTCPSIY